MYTKFELDHKLKLVYAECKEQDEMELDYKIHTFTDPHAFDLISHQGDLKKSSDTYKLRIVSNCFQLIQ